MLKQRFNIPPSFTNSPDLIVVRIVLSSFAQPNKGFIKHFIGRDFFHQVREHLRILTDARLSRFTPSFLVQPDSFRPACKGGRVISGMHISYDSESRQASDVSRDDAQCGGAPEIGVFNHQKANRPDLPFCGSGECKKLQNIEKTRQRLRKRKRVSKLIKALVLSGFCSVFEVAS